MSLSIRARATIYFSLLVATLLLAFALTLRVAVLKSLERDHGARLQLDAQILAELFKEELRLNALDEFREEADQLGLDIRVLDAEGRVVFQSRRWSESAITYAAPRMTADDPDQWDDIVVDGMPHTILSRRMPLPGHGAFLLQLASPKEAILRVNATVRRWNLTLIPVMVLVSVLAGAFFAWSALGPLERLRQRAAALNPDDLSARIPLPKRRDEIFHLTETLNAALGRIEDGFQKMKAFTADASHELRIPLTALRGTLDLALHRDRTPEEYREALRDALEEAERLSRITNDLLSLARADAGETRLKPSPVAVDGFVLGAVDRFRAAVPTADIRVDAASRATVTIDADAIERVLINLLDNAVKYGGGTPVMVAASVAADRLTISVSDGGPGIAPEHRDRIFDRFYRADKARSRTAGGSGLGLAIAAAIARAHGGALSLKNTSPSGCEFELSLPLESSNPPLMRL